MNEIRVQRVSWLPWRRTWHTITGRLTSHSFKLWMDGEPAFHLCQVRNKQRSTLMTFKHGEITIDAPVRGVVTALFGRDIVRAYAAQMGW